MIFSVGVRLEGTAPAKKDTLANIEATGRFVANLVTWDLRHAMIAAAPAQAIITPPSTTSSWPVIYFASSETR